MLASLQIEFKWKTQATHSKYHPFLARLQFSVHQSQSGASGRSTISPGSRKYSTEKKWEKGKKQFAFATAEVTAPVVSRAPPVIYGVGNRREYEWRARSTARKYSNCPGEYEQNFESSRRNGDLLSRRGVFYRGNQRGWKKSRRENPLEAVQIFDTHAHEDDI